MKPARWAGIGVLLGAIATGLSVGSPGALAQDEPPSTVLLSVEGMLEDGDEVIPMDGSLYDEHRFEGKAGAQVTITLASDEFDPYLLVFTPTGELLDQNDDVSEDDFTAQLTLTLPTDGTYTVLANAFDSTGRGQYTLTVDEQETAVDETTVQTESSTDFADYIGMTFIGEPPGQPSSLPGNPIHLGGWSIIPVDTASSDDLRFGISNVLADDTLVLMFSEVIGHEQDGRPIQKVLDVASLSIDNLALTETLQGDFFPTSPCLVDGTVDPEVFAIVRADDQEYFSDIRQAWRANRQTLTLDELPVDGIRCVNSAWGV